MTNKELTALSHRLRIDVLDIIYNAKSGHIGGDLSVMDILVCLYFKHMDISKDKLDDPQRDRLILSKGHSVESLYAVLAEKQFFDKGLLKTVGKFGTKFLGHPTKAVPGIEINSGSLGHGLAVSTGMALAAKRDGSTYRVYTVMGDGELAEGSVWEAAMCASHYKLDNLTAFVDRNGLQISGTTEQVMTQNPQSDRWKSFGWNVIEVDGNSMDSLDSGLECAKKFKGKPTVIIANTTKGYGVSFIENQIGWHHRVPTQEEYDKAVAELKIKGEIA